MTDFFPAIIKSVLSFKPVFLVQRSDDNGGDLKFKNYDELENCFAQKMLHPADLKLATEFYINRLLQPIRQTFESPKLRKLIADAYPAPKKQSESKLRFIVLFVFRPLVLQLLGYNGIFYFSHLFG